MYAIRSYYVELFVVGGVAGLYAWLAKQTAMSGEIWWIPVGLVILGFFRQGALLNRIIEVTTYIQEVERMFCVQQPYGWETTLSYNFV